MYSPECEIELCEEIRRNHGSTDEVCKCTIAKDKQIHMYYESLAQGNCPPESGALGSQGRR